MPPLDCLFLSVRDGSVAWRSIRFSRGPFGCTHLLLGVLIVVGSGLLRCTCWALWILLDDMSCKLPYLVQWKNNWSVMLKILFGVQCTANRNSCHMIPPSLDFHWKGWPRMIANVLHIFFLGLLQLLLEKVRLLVANTKAFTKFEVTPLILTMT